jgi:hypothetical protein
MPLTISAISTIPHVPPPITMPPEPVARAQSATGTKAVQPAVASEAAARGHHHEAAKAPGGHSSRPRAPPGGEARHGSVNVTA